MKLCMNLLLNLIILMSAISCQNSRTFENPEDLVAALFTELKEIDSYEKLSQLSKYFPNRDEMLDILNTTGEGGNIDEHEKSVDENIRRGFHNVAWRLYDKDEKLMQIRDKYQTAKTEEELHQIQNEILSYILPDFPKRIQNARFVSFTRGKSAPLGNLDVKLPAYRRSAIIYEIGGDKSEFQIELMIKTKNGWKIREWEEYLR